MNFDAACHVADWSTLATTLAGWRDAHPGLGVMALLPEREADQLPALQAACRELGITLFGGIFPALIVDNRFCEQGVQLLRFDRCPLWSLNPAANAPAALAELVDRASNDLPPVPTLFLVFDGMLPNIGSLLVDLFGRINTAAHYAGINAGSERFQPMPCLFDSERTLQNAVLGVLTAKPPVVRHGYPVSKSLMRATATTGNRIDHLDGRSPFEVYSEVIRREFGVELTRENFYDYAVHYPFGEISTLNVLVRIPVGVEADGTLHCVGEIPPNSMLKLLRAPALAESHCVEQLIAGLGQPGAAGTGELLTFYCAGRRMHLGPDAERELAQLHAASGASRLIGALSLGEIDSDPELGIPQFHNAALVCSRQA